MSIIIIMVFGTKFVYSQSINFFIIISELAIYLLVCKTYAFLCIYKKV